MLHQMLSRTVYYGNTVHIAIGTSIIKILTKFQVRVVSVGLYIFSRATATFFRMIYI